MQNARTVVSLVNPVVEQLILNLERYTQLSLGDRAALGELGNRPIVERAPQADVAREGENPRVARLLVSGWACRYKDLPDGRRQIVGFFLPGDFCDLNVYILQELDHSVGALTQVRFLEIRPAELDALTQERPRIAQALLWQELVSSAIQREWLLNIGQRSAIERLAHLLVELYVRHQAIGLADDRSIAFPITQSHLAEATGLSPVHVNRTMQELRRKGLIELTSKQLKMLDIRALKDIAMFNKNYLHFENE